MSLSETAFERPSSHWAVQAIELDDLSRADNLVNERLAQRALGQQIALGEVKGDFDDQLLERVLLAYELAAIEGLEELSRPEGEDNDLRNQVVAASSRAFDIRRLSPVPQGTHDRLFFVLQISALAYCGDRWSDLRRWYRENEWALNASSVANVSWDQHLLYRLFHCWVRLFRKDGWDDLDRIRETIAGLRDDQKTMEEPLLRNGSRSADRAIALRLAALYHWARGAKILARFMLQGQPSDLFSQIDKHFEAGINAAKASGNPQHEVILRWLHATVRASAMGHSG